MALTDFARTGYGQVELNQVSAQKTGQIFASLPLDTNVTTLQNGEFMYYDAADGVVTADATTYTHAANIEPYMVYNEIKLYEGNRQNLRHFAMIKDGDNYITSDSQLGQYSPTENATTKGSTASSNTPGFAVTISSPYRMDHYAPRLFKMNIGDIFTTNMIKDGSGTSYEVGDKLTPKLNSTTKTLQLEEDSTATSNVYLVVKLTTMPDGQDAVKLQRIA